MKPQYVYIIAIPLLVFIVLISGCVSNQSSGPTSTAGATMEMSTATPTSAAVITPTALTGTTGQGITSSSLFDRSKFTWYQYKVDSSDMMGMPMVHTYNYSTETLEGQPANHFNFTMDMRPSTLIFLDIWSNPADGSTLKIHEIVYKKGNLTKDADIDAGNYSKFEGEDLASPKFTSARLIASGNETVTVGNKTYTVTNYTGSSGDQQYAYLVSQEVPVPVKFTVHDAKMGMDTTYELTQWELSPLDYSITVLGGVKSPIKLTLADLKSLPQVKEDTLYCEYCEASGDITTYYGPSAVSVLEKAGIPPGEHKFKVTSINGKSITYDREQLENSVIALKEQDKDLTPTNKGSILFAWAGGRNYAWVKLPSKIEILGPDSTDLGEKPANGTIALNITGNVYYPKTYTLADLKSKYVVDETIVGYGNQSKNVTGVSLNALVDEAANKKDAKSIRLIGRDGYTVDLNISDIKKDTESLVAFNDDGTLTAALATEAAKPGPMPFKTWVRDLVSIEVK